MSVYEHQILTNLFSYPTEAFLLLTYSGNAAEIAAANEKFLEQYSRKDVDQAYLTAQAALYKIFKEIPNSLFGRVIARIEQSDLRVQDYPLRLTWARAEIIDCLSQNRLLMQESWAGILGDRRLEDLSYRELNDLSRSLQNKRDQDLVAFIEAIGISQFFLFLKDNQDSSATEKADYIRESLKLPSAEAIFPPFMKLLSVLMDENIKIPPEASYLPSEDGSLLLRRWIQDSDVAAIVKYVHRPRLGADLRTRMISATLLSLKDNLPLFRELRKYEGFRDISLEIVMSDGELPLAELQFPDSTIKLELNIAIIREAISFPSSGFLFLLLALKHSVDEGNWDEVEQLLKHQKITEIVSRPSLYQIEKVLTILRNESLDYNQKHISHQFQTILDRLIYERSRCGRF